ncbi:methyl-accepting chemotaxis protein [Lysobacter korlensis]|uniref:Methyl-accepting chemotaxis protein n=1 Tax=Lysobacter korlensis TaxID=553636 RepID=A0ABV6RJ81_9GAMM
MSVSASALLDRLMTPATRLMSRLTFLNKAIVIGLSFGLTCAVLAGVIATSTVREISATELQVSAGTPLAAMHEAMLGMQQHREATVRGFFDDPSQQAAIPQMRAAVDKQLEAVEAWEAQTLEDQPLKERFEKLRASWKKAQGDHADALAAAKAHEEALRHARLLVKGVDTATGLALASDPAMLYVSRSLSEWLPMLSEYTSRQGVVAIRMFGEGSVWAEDRAQLAVAQNMERYLEDRIRIDTAQIEASAPSIAKDVKGALDAAMKATKTQETLIQTRALDADVPDMPVAEMGKHSSATRAAIANAIHSAAKAYANAGADELQQLRAKALTVALICVLALMLSGYLFVGFSRSTRDSLAVIKQASEMLAVGQFPEKVAVHSRDELRDIGNSIENAVASLRQYSGAQRTMFEAHQAGEIDHRMDTDAFPGAFGVMADETNTLVASHIDVNARLIQIVGQYARGDLSADIERYPGKKAEITAAVDAVKAGMQAVNAEIKALVDAGVAGDLTRRGNAERFEFVYRDIIEGLNRLMKTADHGMGEVGALLSAVADGDLGRRVEVQLPGQFGVLANDANRTVEQLTQIVGEIRQTSDAINSAAGEIASGNNDLSQRTEQQAAALEETASSMEELTSTVRQNAENARQANQLAIGAGGVASQGGAVVGRVVQTMSEINQSSRKVAEIISVIDGIAFQTNILALNAAVEAARAGEQGRGFAVVAAEVRSLAQRSANAAKEIKQLISDSTLKVEEGGALVDQAGKTMAEIVTSVKRVSDIIADIAAASAEQSAGIEQVNQAITHMDEGTQQNAALVEEASASARALEQQAEQLVQTVSVFRVGQAPAPVQVHSAPRAAAGPAVRRAAAAPAAQARPAPRKRAATPVAGAVTSGTGNDHDWQEF